MLLIVIHHTLYPILFLVDNISGVRVPFALVVLTADVFVFSESRSGALCPGVWRPPIWRHKPTESAQLYPLRKVPGAILHVDRYVCWVKRHYTKKAKPVLNMTWQAIVAKMAKQLFEQWYYSGCPAIRDFLVFLKMFWLFLILCFYVANFTTNIKTPRISELGVNFLWISNRRKFWHNFFFQN